MIIMAKPRTMARLALTLTDNRFASDIVVGLDVGKDDGLWLDVF